MQPRILAVLLIGLMCVPAAAQSPEREFTPGPRMIRAIEQITAHYAHFGHSLGLTTAQREAMTRIVQGMKTDMWMKEAVLVGMFQELEEKRRHGLLEEHEYRTANALTGGIETDELTLFIDTLVSLRAVLTEQQRAKLQGTSRPPMEFRLQQGFNTKIGLMSLEGIGRIYTTYRDDLRLSDAQARAIQSLLEEARREVLRLGTEIDLSRVEADELVMRPDVDPEVIRAKMQKTGETEGVLFGKLFAASDQIDAQLTPEQKKKFAELKHHRPPHAAKPAGPNHDIPHGNQSRFAAERFEYFLDEAGPLALTSEQIAALVAEKNQTNKGVLIEEAKLKGAELRLLNLLRNGDTPVSQEQVADAIHGLEQIRSRITLAKAQGYLNARQILSRDQQQRAHPPKTLEHSK
ncbi:MAG TPA: Spy/CpxP family protein refolding chaperone [Nitrospira sp.]|nr:Spy/CpxP family protein refolding chaperone [Nitrospira sp.]